MHRSMLQKCIRISEGFYIFQPAESRSRRVALRIEASSSSRYTAAASLLIATMFISLIICGCGGEFGWGYVAFAITFSIHRARDRTFTRTDSDTLKNRMRMPEWSCLKSAERRLDDLLIVRGDHGT